MEQSRGREWGRGRTGNWNGNEDGSEDWAGTGTWTRVETCERTQDGNGDGSGDGNERSSGDENGDGDGNGNRTEDRIVEVGREVKKLKKPHKSCRRHVGSGGDLGGKRKSCRKERFGPLPANPDNIENNKETGGGRHTVPRT